MFYKDYPFSWQFIVAEFFIVVLGRLLAILLAYYIFEGFKGSPENKLSFKEIVFLAYAAMIRGAIAFGLVENLDEHIFHQKKVIVSSTMVLVISSTVIFGGFTPMVQKWLLPCNNEVKVDNIDKSLEASNDQREDSRNGHKGDKGDKTKINRKSEGTVYEEFIHPNLMSAVSNGIPIGYS
jgi:NhaP-type Na+/H+ or K+/H+ antiporter